MMSENVLKIQSVTSKLVYNIVTGNETWVYLYESEAKQQSAVWMV